MLNSTKKRGIVSARGRLSAWDDFMGIADNYFYKVGRWEESGALFGDFCWGQPRDPPQPKMLSALRGSLENGSKPDTPTDYFGYMPLKPGTTMSAYNVLA